jgi:hypothetical protein
MTVLDRLTIRHVRWIPLLLTLLAAPFFAAGFSYVRVIQSYRWCKAAVLEGAEVARQPRAG